MDFKTALEYILDFEGGLVDHPKDPGGITKFGISLRAYPNLGREGIRNLTKDKAAKIYETDYWDAMRCDELPTGIRLMAFDCAVNQGVGYARRCLQAAASVPVDGVVGPLTMEAVLQRDPEVLANRMANNRYLRYRRNKNWNVFGDGWMARLLHVSIATLT